MVIDKNTPKIIRTIKIEKKLCFLFPKIFIVEIPRKIIIVNKVVNIQKIIVSKYSNFSKKLKIGNKTKYKIGKIASKQIKLNISEIVNEIMIKFNFLIRGNFNIYNSQLVNFNGKYTTFFVSKNSFSKYSDKLYSVAFGKVANSSVKSPPLR